MWYLILRVKHDKHIIWPFLVLSPIHVLHAFFNRRAIPNLSIIVLQDIHFNVHTSITLILYMCCTLDPTFTSIQCSWSDHNPIDLRLLC